MITFDSCGTTTEGTTRTAALAALNHAVPKSMLPLPAGCTLQPLGKFEAFTAKTRRFHTAEGISTWIKHRFPGGFVPAVKDGSRCARISRNESARLSEQYTAGTPGSFQRPPTAAAP